MNIHEGMFRVNMVSVIAIYSYLKDISTGQG